MSWVFVVIITVEAIKAVQQRASVMQNKHCASGHTAQSVIYAARVTNAELVEAPGNVDTDKYSTHYSYPVLARHEHEAEC